MHITTRMLGRSAAALMLALSLGAATSQAQSLTAADSQLIYDILSAEEQRAMIGRPLVRGIDRDPLGADQRLAVADLGHLLLDHLEGVVDATLLGALAEQELAVEVGHGRTLLP